MKIRAVWLRCFFIFLFTLIFSSQGFSDNVRSLPMAHSNPGEQNNSLILDDDNLPIVAFSDTTCNGGISIVKALSNASPQAGMEYAYIQRCVSNSQASNIVLKIHQKTLYVAYKENNRIALQWKKETENNFQKYPNSEAFSNRVIETLNLAIDGNGYPTVVFVESNSSNKYHYIALFKYYENQFNFFETKHSTIPGDLIIQADIQLKATYDDHDNLYIGFLDWNFCPGIVVLTNSHEWVYKDNWGDVFYRWTRNKDHFDLQIDKNNRLVFVTDKSSRLNLTASISLYFKILSSNANPIELAFLEDSPVLGYFDMMDSRNWQIFSNAEGDYYFFFSAPSRTMDFRLVPKLYNFNTGKMIDISSTPTTDNFYNAVFLNQRSSQGIIGYTIVERYAGFQIIGIIEDLSS